MHPHANHLFIPILDNGGGSVRASFMHSFCASLEGRNVVMEMCGDSLAARCRNKIAATFLASGCEEMLMIDADIIFTKEHIALIMSHDLPLVFGIYPKKQVELELCLCTFPDHVPDPMAGLIEVRRAGTGFVKIKRELFERMKEENGGKARKYTNHGRDEWNFWEVGVFDEPIACHTGEYLSEDWTFCERARELGVKVMVDQRIQLRHEGFIVFPVAPKKEAW